MRKTAILLFILSFCATIAWGQDEDSSALFNSYCRTCHDANGDGKTAASQRMSIPDLRSAEIQKLTDDDLFQRIGNGVKHKQYPHTFLKKGMTEVQVRELIGYIRTLKVKN